MSKRFLIACLAALAFSAKAAPLTFLNAQFDVTATAVAGGAADVQSQSSPPDALPIVASASAVDIVDVATAGAIAGPGLMFTSSDVTGGGGIASAVSTARFKGFFDTGRALLFSLDFDPIDLAFETGSATTSLFVLLTSGSTTLFGDYVTDLWDFEFVPVNRGGVGSLELILTSEAAAGFPVSGLGGGNAFGLVTFEATVPAPGTWLLVVLGLGALLVVRLEANAARQG